MRGNHFAYAISPSLFCVTLILQTTVCSTALCQQPTTRHPIPDQAALKSASALVMEVYSDEIESAKSPSQKSRLARKFLNVARETAADPAGQYVLLTKVRDLAVEQGNFRLAIAAIDDSSRAFEFEAFPNKVNAMKLIEKGGGLKTLEKKRDFANLTFELSDQAIARDQFDHASDLVVLATRVARKGKDAKLQDQCTQRRHEIANLQIEYAQVQKARTRLRQEPLDREANLALGRYCCFSKDDWDLGLLMLAIGSEDRFRALANKELKRPEQPALQAEIGDAWWTISNEVEGRQRAIIQTHAAAWYKRALPKLTGLQRAKIDKRLLEAPKMPSSKRGPRP